MAEGTYLRVMCQALALVFCIHRFILFSGQGSEMSLLSPLASEETTVQRGLGTGPGSRSQEVAELGFEPSAWPRSPALGRCAMQPTLCFLPVKSSGPLPATMRTEHPGDSQEGRI